MEATELRISNLVSHKDLGVFEIDGITPHCGDYKIETQSRWIYFKNCQPIPLTEQWLLYFGYKKVLGTFIAKGHLIWCCNDLFMCDKNGIIIKHVHQLQNLYFALTQTELILKP